MGVGSRALVYGGVFLDYIKMITKSNHTSGHCGKFPAWLRSSLFQSQEILITKATSRDDGSPCTVFHTERTVLLCGLE